MKIITKPIDLNKEKFFAIRKIATISAFVVVCLSFLLMLFGAITFKGRPLTAISSLTYLLEFINIGTLPFSYVLSCVAVSGFYIFVIVKTIIDIIGCIKNIKLWLLSTVDDFDTRTEACVVISRANSCLIRYLLLFMVSFMFASFNIGFFSILFLSLLVIAVLAINILRYIMLNGEAVESVLVSFNRMVVLLSALIIVVIGNIQVVDIFNGLLSIVPSFRVGEFANELRAQLIVEKVLNPAMLITSLVFTLLYVRKITDYGFKDRTIPKKFLIVTIVFIVAVMGLLGWSNSYVSVLDYVRILWDNKVVLFVTVMIYLSSMNVEFDSKEIPYFKEKETVETVESNEAVESNESTETSESGEATQSVESVE